MTQKQGIIIVPTKGRPHLLKRFLDCCVETSVTETILLVFDGPEDRSTYEKKYFMPFTVRELIVPKGTPLSGCFNAAVEAYPDALYYGQASDDCTPETPRWDVKLRDACLPDKVSWPCDGLGSLKLPGFGFLGGDLVRKMGFFYPPQIKHWFTDNFLGMLVNRLKIGAYLPHVMVRHRHYINGLAEEDDTYKNQPDHNADGLAYAAYLKGEMDALCERLAA